MGKKSALSPLDQGKEFKRAIDTYRAYLNERNYIGAYVIAFSILEDRVNSMWIARKIKEEEEPERDKHELFAKKIRYLHKYHDIEDDDKDKWMDKAKDRNTKLHAAMWNLDEFREEDANSVYLLATRANNLRKKQKSKMKIKMADPSI